MTLEVVKVYVVVEEPESSSFQDGSTHVTLSTHRSEIGASLAIESWRKSHGEPLHKFFGGTDDDWCRICGSGVSSEEMELED